MSTISLEYEVPEYRTVKRDVEAYFSLKACNTININDDLYVDTTYLSFNLIEKVLITVELCVKRYKTEWTYSVLYGSDVLGKAKEWLSILEQNIEECNLISNSEFDSTLEELRNSIHVSNNTNSLGGETR